MAVSHLFGLIKIPNLRPPLKNPGGGGGGTFTRGESAFSVKYRNTSSRGRNRTQDQKLCRIPVFKSKFR